MTFLLIFLNKTLQVRGFDDLACGSKQIQIDGMDYRLVEGQHFFEWLFAPEGKLLGVELRVTLDDEFLRNHADLKSAPYADFRKDFLRIWFSERRDGVTRSYQDWEDYYYESKEGNLVVALRTHFLSKDEIASLDEFVESSVS